VRFFQAPGSLGLLSRSPHVAFVALSFLRFIHLLRYSTVWYRLMLSHISILLSAAVRYTTCKIASVPGPEHSLYFGTPIPLDAETIVVMARVLGNYD
jgi:hypothetical protein